MAFEIAPWRSFRRGGPFRELERMRREMDRLWESFFERPARRREEVIEEWIPTLDLLETKDELIVKAEVPGIDPKDIDISLDQDVLTIKGQKREEREGKEESFLFRERDYGVFSRSIHLPKAVEGDKISATYRNGILKIKLPKSGEVKEREIKVEVES